MNIGRIRQLREDAGLTQQEAAQAAGIVTKQAWNNIEKGRQKNLTVKTLERMARALGVKVSDLLIEETPVKRQRKPAPKVRELHLDPPEETA